MGKLSRTKGKVFERLIAAELREIYGDSVKRTLMAQARSGTEAADLEGTPWSVECKHNKVCTIQAAFRQATEAGKVNGKPPLVISRDNRSPILVTMSLADFKDLLKKAMEGSKGAPDFQSAVPPRFEPEEDEDDDPYALDVPSGGPDHGPGG